MTRILTKIGLGALSVALASAAQAQEAAPSGPDGTPAAGQQSTGAAIGDIVVTAQRRSESLQKVPLAITAVTSAELERSGIHDLQGVVATVPNLNLGPQLGVAKIALRGIGLENISAGAEGSIAFHVDGVFISRSIAALASFYDVQQVEVLRGPQGTLYGRNATGGAVNLATRGPTEKLTGYANLTVGNYGRIVSEGAISGALVPGILSARIAFQTQDRDGYGTNIVTGHDIDNLRTRAVRGSLRFTPTERLTVDLKADYFREKDNAGGYHYLGAGGFSAPGVPITPTGLALGGTVAANPRDISNEADPTNDVEFWGVSGKAAYDLGGGTQISSLTAYRRTKYYTTTDLDSTSTRVAPQIQGEKASQFSEELQISGKSERFQWLAGLFYFHEKDNGVQADPFNNIILGFPAPGTFVQGYFGGGSITTDALAAFGQATYEVVDRLRLTVGLRYSWERKGNHDEGAFDYLTPYNPGLAANAATLDRHVWFRSFTPRVALDYQVTPSVLLYASWSKGFKAGTYNLGALQPPVNPEKVDAFEGGVKSQLLDRHLQLNLAGFYYDYKDLQVGKVIGPNLLLENAATATIYGLEAEVRAQVTPRFDLNANASWLHARFDSYISGDPARPYGDGTIDPRTGAPAFNLAGNTLSQSPNFTFFVGGQYRLPTDKGAFTLRGEVAWRDRVYFTPFNVKYVSQAPNAKVNLFLNWEAPGEDWRVSLFVKNLTDKTVVGNSYISSGLVGFPINGYLEEPRTFGATIGYKF